MDPLLALCEICVSGNAQFDDFRSFWHAEQNIKNHVEGLQEGGPLEALLLLGRAGPAGPDPGMSEIFEKAYFCSKLLEKSICQAPVA